MTQINDFVPLLTWLIVVLIVTVPLVFGIRSVYGYKTAGI
jgi:hypothetical protein